MGKIPGFYTRFLESYPEVGEAYTSLSSACKEVIEVDVWALGHGAASV